MREWKRPQNIRMEQKFVKIFDGLKRDYGYAEITNGYKDSTTGKFKVKHGWAGKPLTSLDYIQHLKGEKSIGIQPCDDSGMVSFGAIDIDSKAYQNFSPRKYLEIIQKNNLPVIPVKSKSGGLHLYIHTKEKVKASFLRNFLDKLLYTLELDPTTEIYPKQTELGTGSDGSFTNGNFINLPYYNKIERVALNLDGTEFTFDQYIQVVESNLKSEKELNEFIDDHISKILLGGAEEFNDGPPCLQAISKTIDDSNKLPDERDRFLFNYMVFCKKKYPDLWEKKVLDGARKYILYDEEWGDKKVLDKIKSWRKPTAGHLCDQDPIRNFCIKSECAKRQFGYMSDKQKKFPQLSALIRIDYIPEPEFRFTVHFNDKQDGEKSKQVLARDVNYLMDMEKCRRLIASHTPIAPPRIKQDEFQSIIEKLKETETVQPPPAGTSPKELLHKYLDEHIHGVPAVSAASFSSGSVLKEEGFAYFTMEVFFNYLKNKEWKMKYEKTGRMLIEEFKSELGHLKRYPKKDTDKKSHNPIRCVKIPLSFFSREEEDVEILDRKDKDQIL